MNINAIKRITHIGFLAQIAYPKNNLIQHSFDMLQLKKINVYPLYGAKAMKLLSFSEQTATMPCFILTNVERQLFMSSKLAALSVTNKDKKWTLFEDKKIIVSFMLSDFSLSIENIKIEETAYLTKLASMEVNQQISQYFKQTLQLRWIKECFSHNSFLSTLPNTKTYLLINQTSFEFLKQKAQFKLPIEHLKANFIIQSQIPFCEDHFKTIQIGDFTLEFLTPFKWHLSSHFINDNLQDWDAFIKSCEIKQQNSSFNSFFGWIVKLKSESKNINHKMSILDPIALITKQPSLFKRHLSNLKLIKSSDSVQIQFENNIFIGNKKQPLLEQLEYADIKIPSSCRIGICGKCRIKLKKGEIQFLRQTSFDPEKRIILSCISIPKSDLVLKKE